MVLERENNKRVNTFKYLRFLPNETGNMEGEIKSRVWPGCANWRKVLKSQLS